MRISDWSSDVCSSDLHTPCASADIQQAPNSAAAEHRLHGGLNFRLRYMKRSNGVPFARMLSEIMFGRLRAVIAHSREPRQIRFHPQRLAFGSFRSIQKARKRCNIRLLPTPEQHPTSYL